MTCFHLQIMKNKASKSWQYSNQSPFQGLSNNFLIIVKVFWLTKDDAFGRLWTKDELVCHFLGFGGRDGYHWRIIDGFANMKHATKKTSAMLLLQNNSDLLWFAWWRRTYTGSSNSIVTKEIFIVAKRKVLVFLFFLDAVTHLYKRLFFCRLVFQ